MTHTTALVILAIGLALAAYPFWIHLLMRLLRKPLRLHHWRYTHRSGAERECRVCGARESQYIAWVTPPMDPWWETVDEGDTTKEPCGGRREKPARWMT